MSAISADRSGMGRAGSFRSGLPLEPGEWLGQQPYLPMWRRLQAQAAGVREGSASEVIWSCEHEPVYTTGRRGIDNRIGETLPAPLIRVDRGGETTFHGPGQVMLYPVIDLRSRGLSVRDYVALLEQSCIDFLADFGLSAARRCGFPGVWADAGKVAALGVRVAHGVAYHGMALNVVVDSRWFAAINPCGTGCAAINAGDLATLPENERLAACWMYRFAGLL